MLYLKTSLTTPIQFISSGHFVSNVPWIHSRRSIDSFEIIIGFKKCLYISQDEVQYEVIPGSVLLLLPGHVHEGYRICEDDVSFFWLHFQPREHYELIDEKAMEQEVLPLRKPGLKNHTDLYIPLFFSPPGIERIHILFQQLQHVVNSNYYTLHSSYYLVTSLLIEMSEQALKHYSIAHPQSKADQRMAELVEWIRLHALWDISVSEIADKFNYNRDYLSRIFKMETGINLQEYIHLLKISKAKDLLSRSRKSVKEVAAAVGIQDEKYFMRLFKKYESLTPTQYRSAYYRTHMNNH